jgi:type I restriction enzyme M protein
MMNPAAKTSKVIADQLAHGRSHAEAEAGGEAPEFYDTFYVPERASWGRICGRLHKAVGSGLNKALGDLEHTNRPPEGVLQHMDFSRKIGLFSMSDKTLRELIMDLLVRVMPQHDERKRELAQPGGGLRFGAMS